MTTIDRILVPVDFSPSSDAALDHALAIADECGAEVEVLYVWSPRDPEGKRPISAIFAATPEGLAMEQLVMSARASRRPRPAGS